MNQEHYDRIKKACLAQVGRGKKLLTGSFGSVILTGDRWCNPGYTCCAVTALLLEEQLPAQLDYIETVASALGLSYNEVWAFIGGFDGAEKSSRGADLYQAAYGFGKQLRGEVLP